MVGKRRLHSSKSVGISSVSGSQESSVSYINHKMREILGFFEAQTDNQEPIQVNESIQYNVEEIVNNCNSREQSIDKDMIGELFRCIDGENMWLRLTPQAYVVVFHLIHASEQDHYRNEGLKSLLHTIKFMKTRSQDYTPSVYSNLVIGNAIRPLLKNSMLYSNTNKQSLRIMEELLVEITTSSHMSITKSPVDVSESTINAANDEPKLDQVTKRKRNEVADSYGEDVSIYDLPGNHELEEVLVSSWGTRKTNIVKFSPNGPINQGIPSVKRKKQRTSTIRVDNKGSPLKLPNDIPTTPNTIRKNRLSSLPIVGQQRVVKRKDRLLDSATNSINKPLITPVQPISNVGQLRATENLESRSHTGVEGSHTEPLFFPQALVHVDERNFTPPPGHQPSPLTRSSPLGADLVDFDRFLDFDDNVVVYSQALDNVFSSPAKPSLFKDTTVNNVRQSKILSNQSNDHSRLHYGQQVLQQLKESSNQNEDIPSLVEILDPPKREESIIVIPSTPEEDEGGIQKPTINPVSPPNGISLVEKLVGHPSKEETHGNFQPCIVGFEHKSSLSVDPAMAMKPKQQVLNPPELEDIAVTIPDEAPKSLVVRISGLSGVNAIDIVIPQAREEESHAEIDLLRRIPGPNGHQPSHRVKPNLRPHIGEVLEKARSQKVPSHETLQTQIVIPENVCSASTTYNREMLIDPDRTLVNRDTLRSRSNDPWWKNNKNFEMSSTTTGSRSSPIPAKQEVSNRLQQLVDLLGDVNEKILPLLHPAMALLIDALKPLLTAEGRLNQSLATYSSTAHKVIEAYSNSLNVAQTSRCNLLSSIVDLQMKKITDLREVCISKEYQTPHHTRDGLQQIDLIDRAILSLGS